MSRRTEDAEAKLYCEGLGLDPHEVVKGYWPQNQEWIEAPRWTWYRGANLAWDQPLSGFQKAMLRQEIERERALAAQRQK